MIRGLDRGRRPVTAVLADGTAVRGRWRLRACAARRPTRRRPRRRAGRLRLVHRSGASRRHARPSRSTRTFTEFAEQGTIESQLRAGVRARGSRPGSRGGSRGASACRPRCRSRAATRADPSPPPCPTPCLRRAAAGRRRLRRRAPSGRRRCTSTSPSWAGRPPAMDGLRGAVPDRASRTDLVRTRRLHAGLPLRHGHRHGHAVRLDGAATRSASTSAAGLGLAVRHAMSPSARRCASPAPPWGWSRPPDDRVDVDAGGVP